MVVETKPDDTENRWLKFQRTHNRVRRWFAYEQHSCVYRQLGFGYMVA